MTWRPHNSGGSSNTNKSHGRLANSILLKQTQLYVLSRKRGEKPFDDSILGLSPALTSREEGSLAAQLIQ